MARETVTIECTEARKEGKSPSRYVQGRNKKLKTEKRNRASSQLDRMSALEIARLMNREEARVARAVKRALPQVAKAIDIIARRLESGRSPFG